MSRPRCAGRCGWAASREVRRPVRGRLRPRSDLPGCGGLRSPPHRDALDRADGHRRSHPRDPLRHRDRHPLRDSRGQRLRQQLHGPEPVPLLAPSFLAAAILKSFVAIGYNDFLSDPVIPIWVSIVVGIVVALIVQAVVGGDRRRRLLSFGISFVITVGLLTYMSLTGWFTTPTIGPVGIVILSGGIAVGVTALSRDCSSAAPCSRRASSRSSASSRTSRSRVFSTSRRRPRSSCSRS